MGFSRQEYWSGLPFPSPGNLPGPWIQLYSPNTVLVDDSSRVGWGLLSSVQSLSHVWLFATPWTAAHQASLSITNSQSLLKLITIESAMPSAGSQREELRPWQRSWGRRLGIMQRWDRASGNPLFPSIYPQNQSAYFTVLCSHLYLWLYGGLFPHHLFQRRS